MSFNISEAVREGWLIGLEPPVELSVSDWADEYRILSPEGSAEPGPFRTARTPYAREPMNICADPDVEEVVLMWSSQVGKSEMLFNVIGYYADQDPCPQLMIMPTVEMADAMSKDRIQPMFRDSPRLADKIQDQKERHRDSSQTIRHMKFPGGHLTLVGANAPAGLASRPIRIILADEVDRYPVSAGTEGNPVDLAWRRTTTFAGQGRKLIVTSTPTIKGVSEVERRFLLSDQRYYFLPCRHCGHEQHLQWKQVKWPTSEPSKAAYHCEGCGVEWTKADRHWAVDRGTWKATTESQSGAVGFFLNALNSKFVDLGRLATEFLAAKASPATLQTFINTVLAEPFEDALASAATPEKLLARREEYEADVLPERATLVTVGADIQLDRAELQFWAWGAGEEAWSMDYVVLYGDPTGPRLWTQVEEQLLRRFRHPLGGDFGVEAAAIDSGYATQHVYDFAGKAKQMHRPWYAVKGVPGDGKTMWKLSQMKFKQGNQLFLVGTDTAKNVIYSRYQVLDYGPGYIHIPTRYELPYCEQMTSHKVRLVYNKGMAKREWFKADGVRDEALDTTVYALAARHSVSVDFAGRLARLQNQGSKPKVTAADVARMFQ